MTALEKAQTVANKLSNGDYTNRDSPDYIGVDDVIYYAKIDEQSGAIVFEEAVMTIDDDTVAEVWPDGYTVTVYASGGKSGASVSSPDTDVWHHFNLN